jgi:16S rRNA (uracil1498-N3)-methyltransferase
LSERRRFIIEPAESGSTVRLGSAEAAHVRRVLRLGAGDTIEGVDGRGWLYTLELCAGEGAAPLAKVLDKRRCRDGPGMDVVVAVGLIKGARMDWAVEKAAELGARSFVPFAAERTVAPARVESAKVGRWRRIAAAALKQSLGARLMRVGEPCGFDRVLRLARALPLVLVGAENGPPLGLEPEERSAGGPCLLVFGPEGDLTPAELGALENTGARVFSLGPLRLRTETAVIAGLSAFRQECRTGPDR